MGNTTYIYSYDREHNYKDEYENWYDLKCTKLSSTEKVVWELIDHEWEEIERVENPEEYHEQKRKAAEKKWEIVGMKGGIRKEKNKTNRKIKQRLRVDSDSRHEIIQRQRIHDDGSLGEVEEVPIF